jgi:hypothetical protein
VRGVGHERAAAESSFFSVVVVLATGLVSAWLEPLCWPSALGNACAPTAMSAALSAAISATFMIAPLVDFTKASLAPRGKAAASEVEGRGEGSVMPW